VDETGLVEERETVQELLRKDAHEGGAEAPELVLLDELVEVDAQQLKHEAQVLPVDERVLEAEQVVVVVLVELGVELEA
jgi:hypothetical protein